MVSCTLTWLRRALGLGLLAVVASSAFAQQARPDIVWRAAFTSQPSAVAVSADGNLIACGHDDSTVTIHRALDGGIVRTLNVQTERITALAFLADGQRLAVGARGSNLTFSLSTAIWRLSDGSVDHDLYPLIPGHYATGLKRTPDGRYVVWGSVATDTSMSTWDARTVGLYDPATRSMARYYDTGRWSIAYSVAVSRDGALIAAGCYGDLYVWRLADNTRVPLPNATGYSQRNSALAFSPDGTLLAVGAGSPLSLTTSKEYVRIWSLQDGVLVRTLAGHTAPANSVAFMSDGVVLVSASGAYAVPETVANSAAGGVRFWRVSDGELLQVWQDTADVDRSVVTAQLTPDETLIAYATRGANPSLVLARNPYGPTAPTTIDLPTVNGRIGDNVTITANLWNSGRPVADRALSVTIDGVALGSATTDAAGHVTLPYTVPEGAGAGTREIAAEFAGDATYSAARATAGLTVAQTGVGLFLPHRTGPIEALCYLKAYLYRRHDHGRPVGRTIAFAVDGVAVGSVPTDEVGQAVLPYVIPEGAGPGARALASAWAGDQAYGPAAASSTLTVTQGAIYLWLLEPRTVTRGGAVYLRAYARSLPYYNWKPGLAIGFAVDGTDVGMARTNADGRADWYYVAPLNSSLGDHTFTCTFYGNALYGPTERTGALTVTP